MDLYNKIQFLSHMSQERLRQLELEEQMDQKITAISQQCPEQLLAILLKIRQVNRKVSADVYKSSVLESVDKIKKNIGVHDQIFQGSQQGLDCHNLATWLSSVEKL